MVMKSVANFTPPAASSGTNNYALNGTTTKVAFILRAPAAGTITAIAVRPTAAGTPQPVSVIIEGVDASGNPDGSAVGGCVAASFTPAAATHVEVTFATHGATVAAGQLIAIVFSWVSDVGDITIGAANTGNDFPYAATYASSAWTHQSCTPLTSLSYSGVYYCAWTQPALVSTTNMSTSLPVDQMGNYWVPTVDRRVLGARYVADTDGDLTLQLLDASNNVLASAAIDKDQRASTSSGFHVVYFTAPYVVAHDNAYRLVLLSGGTTTSTMSKWAGPSFAGATNAFMGAYPVGVAEEFYMTSRAVHTSPTWTEAKSSLAYIFPLIDQVGVGGGGAWCG